MVPFARGDCWGDLVAYWKPGLWWWGWEANEKLFCILYMCVDHVECIKIRDGRYEKFPVSVYRQNYTAIIRLYRSDKPVSPCKQSIWKSKRYNKLDIKWNTSHLQLALL